MTTQTLQKIVGSAGFAFVAAITIVIMAFISFIIAEPQVGHSQVDRTFFIRQTITDETTFLVDPTDVTMAGNISGITGGNSTGTSQFVIQSNNATGYLVSIEFEDNAGLYAMRGDTTGSQGIRDYENDVANEPSFGFATSSAAAVFAYTVSATSSTDLDDSFVNNGANACNEPVGGSPDYTEDICWKAPTSTDGLPYNIIDRGSSAITGATSTIKFRVHVPPNASPVPTAETYTATATLSLITQ